MERKNLEKLKEIEGLLVCVDMVNGFVKNGALADPYITHIIPEVIRLFEMYTDKFEARLFIKEAHKKGCSEFERYPEHCLEGTYEASVVDELLPYENGALVYKKNSTSTIFASNFMNNIKEMKKLREVIITGCCTDICVMNLAIPLQNYFDQINSRVRIVVPKNAVETFEIPGHKRNEWNEMAFKFMNQAGIETPEVYKKEMR